MELTLAESKNLLREVGLRSTNTRVATLQQLWREDRPVSHSELVQTIHVGDQATVYRSLVTIVEKGLARVASTAGGVSRYEVVHEGEESHEVHPHFVCNSCGVVSCLPKTVVITKVDSEWRDYLQEALLQFVGVCVECR